MAEAHDYGAEVAELLNDYEILRVLRHFQVARVDYAKNVTRYTEIPQERVRRHIERLREMGLLDIYRNTSIKRTEAKLKKSAEVHKHHTYFMINRKGELALKSITPKAYAMHLSPEELALLCRREDRVVSAGATGHLVSMGLVDRELGLTDLGTQVLDAARRMHLVRCEGQRTQL
ncbi:hypothetical protein GCM10007108_11450 [Thermogymnomonas acidicola]|uniref:Uncharacterized protein n=1 Tax=Thermogymnomonas acidicola TaxID=399579 RepID=A0AA37BRM4_9ARCH|nr:DUF2250 domain-containing protein [Thermogymnomonas acidicola]GGM75244.1 hypothetical protein GCM10007108_11450 [Thermogymnomonas acidicola]